MQSRVLPDPFANNVIEMESEALDADESRAEEIDSTL